MGWASRWLRTIASGLQDAFQKAYLDKEDKEIFEKALSWHEDVLNGYMGYDMLDDLVNKSGFFADIDENNMLRLFLEKPGHGTNSRGVRKKLDHIKKGTPGGWDFFDQNYETVSLDFIPQSYCHYLEEKRKRTDKAKKKKKKRKLIRYVPSGSEMRDAISGTIGIISELIKKHKGLTPLWHYQYSDYHRSVFFRIPVDREEDHGIIVKQSLRNWYTTWKKVKEHLDSISNFYKGLRYMDRKHVKNLTVCIVCPTYCWTITWERVRAYLKKQLKGYADDIFVIISRADPYGDEWKKDLAEPLAQLLISRANGIKKEVEKVKGIKVYGDLKQLVITMESMAEFLYWRCLGKLFDKHNRWLIEGNYSVRE